MRMGGGSAGGGGGAEGVWTRPVQSKKNLFTLSLSIRESGDVAVTFAFVNEIQKRVHSKKTLEQHFPVVLFITQNKVAHNSRVCG